jgi:general secretion pathway protein M
MIHAVSEWLERRPPRERQLLILAGVLIVLAVVWWVAIAPALQTYRISGAAHAKLDAELAKMQAMALEAKQIKDLPIPSNQAAQAWLDESIKKLGKATLVVQGTRAQISFAGARAEALATWLAQARTAAQLLPVQANWRRAATATGTSTNPDTLWDGMMVLELPAK